MVGLDEVGRGAWAGPLLVVAARSRAVLPRSLGDSKVLTKRMREQLVPVIQSACDIGYGWVSPREIDSLGLSAAMKLAVRRACSDVHVAVDEEVVMDGMINYLPATYQNVRCIIKADSTVPIVSAASIVAKVARDAFMASLAKTYPDYCFETNVGYGTEKHRHALVRNGPTRHHRMTFKPLQEYA